MNFKFWRAAPPKGKQLPRLSFDIHPGSQVFVSVSWPDPQSQDEGEQTCHDMAGLILTLSDGKLLPQIRSGVSLFGQANSSSVADGVLLLLDKASSAKQQKPRPVVPPTQAFAPPGRES